jgi:outer membrane lipoprotein-sorting protein
MRTTRSQVLRWAVPGLVAAAVAVAASGMLTADATAPLPPKTAAQLLVDLQNARIDGLSGTVVQNSDLGLPTLPTNAAGHGDNASLFSMLGGSHTLRVWYAGPDKQRVALLGSLGETDIVHNGQDGWVWSSAENTATHYRLSPRTRNGTDRGKSPAAPLPTPLTPQQAAEQALAAISPTTSVSTDGTGTVAGRSVYELVLAPKDTRSLIGQVRLAVDAETSVPLRVQVFPQTTSDGPAFEVGFTRVSFGRPADDQFRFSPPPGAKVQENPVMGDEQSSHTTQGVQPGALIGTGWTTVAVLRGVSATSSENGSSDARQLAAILSRLPQVSGSWGSGRLLTSKLVTALLTDDGRLIVGAVSPELIYAAAGHR